MNRTIIIRFDARTLVLAGALLVIFAAWLPWTSLPSFVVGGLARSGMQAGGLVTFVLAILALLGLLLPWRPWGRVSMSAAILAMLIELIALAAFARTIQHATVLEMDLGAQLSSVGSGLYMTFAGAWLMLFGGLAEGTPIGILAWERGWMGYAAWAALIVVVFAACLCAWSIGLIVRPYTIDASPQQVATFGPAPTVYLATPLVGVQLEPLGNNLPALTPAATLAAAPKLAAPTNPLPTFTPTKVATPVTITSLPSPTALTTPTAHTPTRTTPPLPTSTQLPLTGTPPATMTPDSSRTPDGSRTPTSTQVTSPSTSTHTPTLPSSPVGTPTLPTSPVGTPTTTP